MAHSENVLMFFHAPSPGEQRSSIKRTLRELDAAGFTVHTIAAPHAWLSEEDGNFVRHQIWIPGKRNTGWVFWLYFSFAAFSTLLILAVSQRSRAIITFRPALSLLAKPVSLGTWTPIALFLDSVPRALRGEGRPSLIGTFVTKVRESLGLFSAKRIVPSTNAAARAVHSAWPVLRRRIRPLSYALSRAGLSESNTDEVLERSSRKKALQERWGISDKRFVLGVYDRLHDHKSIECVMRAIAASEQSNIQVVIFSTGPARRLIDSISVSLGLAGQTMYASDASDSIPEASACDLFLLAPGFCSAPAWLSDLLASGVPLLGPDVPVLRELLGEEDLLYQAFHVEALAIRLRQLSTEAKELQRIGSVARQRAEHFVFDRQAALGEVLSFGQPLERLAEVPKSA